MLNNVTSGLPPFGYKSLILDTLEVFVFITFALTRNHSRRCRPNIAEFIPLLLVPL